MHREDRQTASDLAPSPGRRREWDQAGRVERHQAEPHEHALRAVRARPRESERGPPARGARGVR